MWFVRLPWVFKVYIWFRYRQETNPNEKHNYSNEISDICLINRCIKSVISIYVHISKGVAAAFTFFRYFFRNEIVYVICLNNVIIINKKKPIFSNKIQYSTLWTSLSLSSLCLSCTTCSMEKKIIQKPIFLVIFPYWMNDRMFKCAVIYS